ncbi:C1 family peptidase [Dysgonomonas sp. 520]|uniref:C1 family peptidase n=1 Tax=Dysgonomonas sp. 520 TaxID=2302931 RepID=UPI0013D1BE06|nr:C1 family peptidase [Dysgonomonas sp. 520]NDW10168.1 hypothetical protein [Dysgonomonas sp. 520]
MANYEYKNWDKARRSPSFIHNQVPHESNCHASRINDAMLLLRNVGVCSYSSMPYTTGDCSTQPNNQQNLNASMHKIAEWGTIKTEKLTDPSILKKYLDLGYPLIISFSITPSFDNMWHTNDLNQRGMWDKFSPEESNRGGHAACIVGYHATEKKDANGNVTASKILFKVINSWGTEGGDNGYFYIPAETIEKGALKEIHLFKKLLLTKITGPTRLKATDVATFEVVNLPSSVDYISWGASYLSTFHTWFELLESSNSIDDNPYLKCIPKKSGTTTINLNIFSESGAYTTLTSDKIIIESMQYNFTMSPNPITLGLGALKISITTSFGAPVSSSSYRDCTVQIYDLMGNLKKNIAVGGSGTISSMHFDLNNREKKCYVGLTVYSHSGQAHKTPIKALLLK